jgi:hypothetical protein
MDTNRRPGTNVPHEKSDNTLSRCLSPDLEVSRNDDRIHALASVRPDDVL